MPRDDDDYDDRPRPRRRRRDDDDEDDDDYDDRPRRRRRRSDDVDPAGFIVPTDVSAWSIISCYAGLIGFCIPFLGVLFAIVALVCGIVALRRRKKASSYGAVTSDVRAVIGVILSSLTLLGHAVFLVLALSGVFGK